MNFAVGKSDTKRKVSAVNLAAGVALLDNGDCVDLEVFLDCCGEECGPQDAVVAVSDAYTGEGNLTFFTIDLSEFDRAYVQ
jgi:stress response protein SCP2